MNTLQFVNSGTAATVADPDGQANGLKSLLWSLRAPYRSNASWLMNSATASSIDRLKDANKNYVWKSSNTAGAPDELLGYAVEIDENMPSEGAGLFPVAIGDFKRAYTVVDWDGIKAIRDEVTNKPNVIFYAYRRTGGGLSNHEAVKLLKCASS
jgi:HK97 family phage major capsid protein